MKTWEKTAACWEKTPTFLRTRILKCCLQQVMQYFCSAFQNNLVMMFQQLSEPSQPQLPSSLCSSHGWNSGFRQGNRGWGRQVSMETCLVSARSSWIKTSCLSQRVFCWFWLSIFPTVLLINSQDLYLASADRGMHWSQSEWLCSWLSYQQFITNTSFFPSRQTPDTHLHNVCASVCAHTQVPKIPS